METTQTQVRRCTVYGGRGHAAELAMELEPLERDLHHHTSASEPLSIRTIMSRDLLCARPDLEVSAVVRLMLDRRAGCLPIVDERRRPIGIITKLDLVEQLDAAMRLSACGCSLPSDLKAQTADDVMMPLALTLDEHAPILHAASMMMSEDTHHILVVSAEGALVGVVSSKDIVRWVTEQEARPGVRLESSGPPAWHPLES